jgi:tetratricopeptide (TPR) repeat protein
MLATTYTWIDWRWPAAEPEFRRAIELRPNYAEARAFYSHYLYIMHRTADGRAQMQQAIETDPLSEFVRLLYGMSLEMDHQYESAEAQWRVALTTSPNSPVALTGISESLHYMRRYDEALEAERALWRARGDVETDEALRRGFAEAGYSSAMHRAAEVQALRATAEGQMPVRAVGVAKLYARSGQYAERQIEWLERAVESHDPNIPYVVAMPIFDGLHAVPRFQRLVARLNLPM